MKRVTWLLALLVLLGIAPEAWAGDEGTGPCTLATFAGRWGLTLEGFLLVLQPPLAGPAALTGGFTDDGRRNFSGSNTVSVNGAILTGTFAGTRTVNPDCTGSVTVLDSNFGPLHFDFVAVDKRRELRVIQTDPGTVIIGSARRQ